MIFVDASRYNNTAEKTGVEIYSVHLIDALVRLAPSQITLISPRKIPLETPQLVIPFPRLWTQGRLSLEVLKNKALRQGTLFIPSHQMPIIHPARTVITIHDVAFKRFPECYGLASRTYLDWGARYAARHANKIIVPSQVTKNDLIELYKADPSKITVIPHGYTPLTAQGASRWSQELKNQKYFLFVGRLERKKNLLTLIEAFTQFQKNHLDFKLMLVGKPHKVGGPEIMEKVKTNPAVIAPGYVSDAEKIDLYKNAYAFILPSLYEGFGIPLLEAMQFNLPIISSNLSACREVAGEVARFFDPKDVDGLADLMEQFSRSRPSVTQKCQETLAKYFWEECAKKTLDLLH